MKAPRILGIIPARGGSKGLPRKNLALLCGKPLVYYVIQAALASSRLTRTILSSDDPEIIRVGKEYGAEAPFTRPAELATDSASSAAVAHYTLEWIESDEGKRYDYVCLLEPTSPLRTPQDIDDAIEILLHAQADAVVSVSRIEAPHPVKTLVIAEGRLKPFFPSRWRPNLLRQDLEPVYAVNGAVYCVKRDILVQSTSFWGSSAVPYIMPAERSVNVDTLLDLKLAEALMENGTSQRRAG